METPEYVINISSEEEIDDNDVEVIEFRKQTQNLLDNPEQQPQSETNRVSKKLADVQCPICFDDLTNATITSCGHIFCLECILQSLSSSHARGQVSGRNGTGRCPMCRKNVTFKDTIVLRMKLAHTAGMPVLPPLDNGVTENILDVAQVGDVKRQKTN